MVHHRARAARRSKYGLRRVVKVMLDLMTIWFLRRYQSKPVYVFGGIGLAVLSLGAALGAVVLWEKIEMGVWVHRNPLFLIAITCVLMGVQFLGFKSILAETIMRTYFESQDKTAYSVAKQRDRLRPGTLRKMCGIVGHVPRDEAPRLRSASNSPRSDIADPTVRTFFDVQGEWRVALGHRRLAIIDLQTGAQPMEATRRATCTSRTTGRSTTSKRYAASSKGAEPPLRRA